MDWRPSSQLNVLLHGRVAWDDAAPAIRSWARLTIYHAADKIAEATTAQARKDMLAKIPASLRPQVKAEAEKLWLRRKK